MLTGLAGSFAKLGAVQLCDEKIPSLEHCSEQADLLSLIKQTHITKANFLINGRNLSTTSTPPDVSKNQI